MTNVELVEYMRKRELELREVFNKGREMTATITSGRHLCLICVRHLCLIKGKHIVMLYIFLII